MLFYESARLVHGRPYPFNGENYANVFAHYRPTDHVQLWPYESRDIWTLEAELQRSGVLDGPAGASEGET